MPQMTIPVVRVGRTRKGKGDHIRYEGGTGAGGYWIRFVAPAADCEGVGQVNVTFTLNGTAPKAKAAPAVAPASLPDAEVARITAAVMAALQAGK